jgi:predicted RNA binding protein YcfA (HicA-like mRNA interferase family)
MPNLPVVSGEQAIRAFERIGFRRVRQRGSHVVLRKDTPDGAVGCVIPLHRELAPGTLRGILKQSKVTVEEFSNALT